MTDGPLTDDHPDVIWTDRRSITIGASDDGMEVHLPPESAAIQSCPVVDVAATDDVEGVLWEHGYDAGHRVWTDILEVDRKALHPGLGRRDPVVYCYSVLFSHGVIIEHYDTVRGHFSPRNWGVGTLRGGRVL